MEEEFEAVILNCGHSINSYTGLGICDKCRNKTCGNCLQSLNGELLCLKCFEEILKEVKCDE